MQLYAISATCLPAGGPLTVLVLFLKMCYILLASTIPACLFVGQNEQGCSLAMMRVPVDYRVVVASPTLLTT